MEKLKFGIVGFGHIGKRHAHCINENANTELVAIADINVDQLKATEVSTFSSLESMLAEQQLDVVCICTPNGVHAEHAVKAIEAGSHVIVEKPMGISVAQCQSIIDAADKINSKVICVMQNRYSPPAKWLKSVVQNNILGEIYMVDVCCYWNRDERYYSPNPFQWRGTKELDGGTLFTQFSHFIDLLYWIFGDASDVSARFADFKHQNLTEFEDSGMLHFTLGQNTQASFNYSTAVADKNFESSIRIVAEKGTVGIGGQYMNELEYCEIQDYEAPSLEETQPANNYGSYSGSANNHPAVIQNCVDVLLNNKEIATTAREGLKVVEIIEQIYKLRKS